MKNFSATWPQRACNNVYRTLDNYSQNHQKLLFCVSKWRIRDKPLFIRLHFFPFPSFTIIACVNCLFESHSYNKEKYAHKWPVDCTRHHKFFFSVSLSKSVRSTYLYFVKLHWLLCEMIFPASLWKRNYIVLWSCLLPHTI